MRVLALSVAFAAIATCASAQQERQGFDRPYWLDRAVIEAIGRAEIEVPPDRASFSVTYQQVAREAGDASANAADRARLAIAAMRQRGGQALKITSSIAIEPIYQQYRDRDGQRVDSDRADQIENYVARVRLDVEVTEITRAAEVRAAAMAVGPEASDDISYSLRQTGEHYRRVFGAAAEDAAARARLAAQASGGHLGPLMVLQEGQGPCLGSWSGARPGMMSPPAPPPPPSAARNSAEDIVVTGSRGREMRVTQEQIARLDLPADLQPITLTASVCAVYVAAP